MRKPLLEKFKALHDYECDTLMIPSNGKWTTLINEVHMEDSDVSLWGNGDSSSRQVSSSILHNMVSFDKHHLSKSPLEIAHALRKLLEGKMKRRQPPSMKQAEAG